MHITHSHSAGVRTRLKPTEALKWSLEDERDQHTAHS